MAGPLGNIHTVSPNQYMPNQPRFVGTPGIDAAYRADQNIRAQQNHDQSMDKARFEKTQKIADIANKQAFSTGLQDIVANPGMAEGEQNQKIGLLAANTGQSDITLKMQDQEYARQTKMEAQVLELAGNGNVAAAKHLAQQHGIQMPDAVLNDGLLAKGFALGVKLYDYDPRQAGIFATEFRRNGGDYNAALQVAGEPVRKPQTYAPSFSQVQGANGEIFTFDQRTGAVSPTGVQGVPKNTSFTPITVTKADGTTEVMTFDNRTGQMKPTGHSNVLTGKGALGGLRGANGGRPTAYEVKVKLFEDAYAADYPDATSLRKAALEHVDRGKPLDPVRLKQSAMKMVMQQETIAGTPLYKTQAEREAAAEEIVRYSLGNGEVGSSVSPPVATTPGAPSRAPSTKPLEYTIGGAGLPNPAEEPPPPPPGFALD